MSINVLLVWDSSGEDDPQFFYIQSAPEWLVECNGKYINSSEISVREGALLNDVYDAITSDADCHNDPDGDLAGMWVGMKIETVMPRTLPRFQIVVSGYVP